MILCGCFSSKGPGNLVRVNDIMNSVKYQDILNLNLAAPARKLKLGRPWAFQQDNDPRHVSKSTQKRLRGEKVCKEEWSQIPLSVFYNLMRCYERRICAVLLAKGGYTKY